MIVTSFSKSGGHTNNEDALIIMPHPKDKLTLLCVLADGQGGRPGGQLAATAACEATIETACTYSPKRLTNPSVWLKILRSVDQHVYETPEAGATTLVAACVSADVVCGASNGDSAAVLLNVRDKFTELTHEQVKNPPVGSQRAKFIPFSEKLIDPWLVMLASDGLWKYVGWSSVKSSLRAYQGRDLINALTADARSAGNGTLRDDTSIILVESS